MVWFRWGCTAFCGWNVRFVGVRGDAWSVMLSPCNTLMHEALLVAPTSPVKVLQSSGYPSFDWSALSNICQRAATWRVSVYCSGSSTDRYKLYRTPEWFELHLLCIVRSFILSYMWHTAKEAWRWRHNGRTDLVMLKHLSITVMIHGT